MGKIHKSITIDAPINNVWQTIRNFHDMSWAPNVITNCTPVGERKGHEVGAKRILNDLFHETLLDLDDNAHTIRYSIDDGPPPLSKDAIEGYVGVVKVRKANGGDSTDVEWTSSWNGAEKEVQDFCLPMYVALLDDMKKSLS